MHVSSIASLSYFVKARLFLLVDFRDSFSDLGSGAKINKLKSSENDQLTGHFQSFFFIFNISRKKTVKLVR